MIDILFFVFQIIGILVLVGWAVVHDRIAAGGPTGGPLAFKANGSDAVNPSPKRRQRTGLTRHRGEANLKDRRR